MVARYQENAPRFSALPSSGGQAPSVDFTGGGVLSRIREQHMQQREQQAMARAAERGLEQQGAEGTATEPVGAPENWASRYQQQFQKQARRVQSAQLKQDAERTRFQLALEHEDDPDGYAHAWDAYMQGVVGELQDADGAAAAEAQLALDEVGLQQYQRLQEQRIARERAVQSAEYMQGVEGTLVEARNNLLRTGDEESWLQATTALEDELSAGVEDGLIDPGQAMDFARQQRTVLTEEFARGSFAASVRAGDFMSAGAVIDALNDGQWFEDNRDARRVANSLQQELSGLTQGDGTGVGAQMRQLERLHAAVRRGDSGVTHEQMQDHVEFVLANGSESQVQRAGELLMDSVVEETFTRSIDDIPLQQLTDPEFLEEVMAGARDHLSPEQATRLSDKMESRRQALSDAVAEGDLTAAVGELRPSEYGPTEEGAAQFQRDVSELRTRAGQVFGMSPDAIFPYPRQYMEEVTDQFQRQYQDGDFDGMTNTVAQYLSPGRNQWEQHAFTDRLPAGAAAFRVAGQLTSFGRATDAQDVLQLAQTGENVSDQAMFEEFNRRAGEEVGGMTELIAGITQGDTRRVQPTIEFLTDLYRGVQADQLNRGGSRRGVEREFNRLVEPFKDTVEFANGFRLPADELDGHPLGRRVVQSAIDEVLEDPARLGLDDPSQTENWRNVAPVPLSQGVIAFVDRRTGRMVFDNEADDYLLLNAEDLVTDEAMRAERRAGDYASDAVGRLGDEVNRAFRGIGTIRASQRAETAAKVYNANPALVDRLTIASRAVPPETHAGNRDAGAFGVPLDIEDRVDRQDVVRRYNEWAEKERRGRGVTNVRGLRTVDQDASLVTSEMAPFAMAAYVSQLEEKYGTDELVGAAYWAGPEVLDALIDEHGEDEALRHLPVEVRKLMKHTFEPRQRRPRDPEVEEFPIPVSP